MARVAVSPASLICLVTDIIETPVNTGKFKWDCSNLARRVSPLRYLLEEISDSSLPTESDDSSSLTSYESEWWSDLVVGLQAAKGLMYSATSYQALTSYDLGKERRIALDFQIVTWTLEKALGNVPYDQYKISDEVRQQVELARSQLTRAMELYGYINTLLFSQVISKPIEKYVFTNTRRKEVFIDKFESVQETVHSNISLESPSPVSLAFILSKDAEDERLEKAIPKNKSEKITIPEDFLCPISLEMMIDPVIISTGQTYEKSYIQRWIDCGNLTCPKTRRDLENFSLTPNYVLKSLISQWCTKHNIEQPGGNVKTKKRDISGDILAIEKLVRKFITLSFGVCETALIEICTLSKKSMENRIMIARAGAIRILVYILDSYYNETQENAVACVLNLSLCEDNKELIMKAGGVTSLVHVLREGTMEARENAAATLFSLSLVDENKIKIGESGAIQALVKLLENGSVRGKKDAATALVCVVIKKTKVERLEPVLLNHW